MRIYRFLRILMLPLLTAGCSESGTGSWNIPLEADLSDLQSDPVYQEVFRERRERVLSGLGEGTIILCSSDPASHNRHEFRPNNYFYYLTGMEAPDCYAILSNSEPDRYILVLRPPTIRSLIYEGQPASKEETEALYRPDRILEWSEFANRLSGIFSSGQTLYMDRSDPLLPQRLGELAGWDGFVRISHVGEMVDEMRVIKGSPEVLRLQKACNITAKALVSVMENCAPGKYEFEMEAIIEGTFRRFGAAMPGFASIVGSGPNSTILHYERNTRKMEEGDLLLMDIGAEYGFYTADISRTIPVSGKFGEPQKTIYQLVLDAQRAGIEQMKPGNMFMDGHMAAREVLVEGLTELGLITDPQSPWQIRFYILYPSSHFLGMDVHDVGEMGGSFSHFMQHTPGDSLVSRVLEPGMVLTIEPGLYFREKGLEQLSDIFGSEADSAELAAFAEQVRPVYARYRNIGVRIEDDILITASGNLNLSRYAPREIAEIEAIMNK
ncbi:MAG TPA: aminopeptidase P family protein [Bacteroides sp.]|nr:aminopeptidase P family protein [Bacteroides sp.]